MMTASSCPSLHGKFLAILPRIVQHARVVFRSERPDRKEEFVQETAAVCWLWFGRLVRRGKDPTCFSSSLAGFAVRFVRAGRKLTGAESCQEVLSPWTQSRYGFEVRSLPEGSSDVAWLESLRDNSRSPVADQAAFRVDFPRWLRRQSSRDRRIIRKMLRGERTQDLARKYHLSPGRISQMRRELYDSWQQFHGDSVQSAPAPR
jgi:hypothetical protein